MSKILKKLFIVLTLSLAAFFTVQAISTSSSNDADPNFSNYQFIEDAKLASSRYTRPDDMSIVDPQYYVSIDSRDDQLIEENDHFQLYYNESNVSFKVLNKDTGYVWATAIDNPNAGTYNGLLSSGLGIEYIQPQKDMQIVKNVGVADTVFQALTEPVDGGIKISLHFGGFCSTRNCKRLYPAYLEGRYTLEQMMAIGFTEINVGFDLVVTLDDQGINAFVPHDSIYENDPDNLLISSIILFPALGATEMDQIPGYMVIPDGSGALIRYEDNQNQFLSPFESRYFGQNYGLQDLTTTVTNYSLGMPIFGAVHGVDQNAFVGIIEQGEYNARLLAYPNGAHNLPYNLIFPKYDLRQVYRQSFSSDGSGGAMKNLETSTSDIEVRYNFLENANANYVGIGRSYRQYLLDQGVLQNQTTTGDIPLFTEYLMADNKNSFFGNMLVKMSTTDQVRQMYDFFLDAGIANQRVGLIGWNEGGFSGHTPAKVDFENGLGSNKRYRELIDYINQQNSVMLINDYVFSSNDAPGISYRNDVAKGSNRFKMMFSCDSCVHTDTYVLYPTVSEQLALDAFDKYQKENVNVLFSNIASVLFSYYDGAFYNRTDALAAYMHVMETYNGMASYFYPYSYAFAYTDSFYEAPLYNSQLKYYDDVVPLLSIVLKGSIDMYASLLNYNSLGKETLLNVIDYGMNPAYILTDEPSSRLKDTDMGRYFTTEFSLWKDTVVSEYTYVNDALKYVRGAEITNRIVLDYGIVKVTYSNGVDIYINYTSHDYPYQSLILKSMDYYVGGVSG